MTRPWDIVASVHLFPSEQGGRRGATPRAHFNCIMAIADLNLDVRLHFHEGFGLVPGETARVAMSFLNPELARGHCSVGQRFVLRELHPIAEGIIEEAAFGEPGRASASISRVA